MMTTIKEGITFAVKNASGNGAELIMGSALNMKKGK
jgi:hypothetical protein